MDIKAELISIGNELLSGQTLNTHGRDLGAALSAIGLQLERDTTILDEIPAIQQTVREALDRTDLLFISGGLGPTVDDMTREALAGLFGQAIVPHPSTIAHLHDWYTGKGRKMTPAGERQALVLEKAAVLPNPIGAAPGQRLDLPDHKTLFVLPGPPKEFNAILQAEIVPWLRILHANARPKLVRIVHTKGIGESDIVTILEAARFNPANMAIGFYPGMGKVEIRLTALPEFEQDIENAAATLRTLLADHLDPNA